MPDFKLYRSDDSLLIRGIGEHDIDLPNEDALRLADAIRGALVPPATSPRAASNGRHYTFWTDEMQAELVRLYTDECLPIGEIARRFGIKTATADNKRRALGLAPQNPERSAQARENMLRVIARRKAA